MTRVEEVQVTKTVKVYVDPTCDRCQTALDIDPMLDQPGSRQYTRALNVVLRGSYGMYYDMERHDLFLCQDCAEALEEFLGIDSDEGECQSAVCDCGRSSW